MQALCRAAILAPMGRPLKKLRIWVVRGAETEAGKAEAILERLGAKRRVDGEGPWVVIYEAADLSEAYARCAEELSEIDASWFEVLDFSAAADSAARSSVGSARPG